MPGEGMALPRIAVDRRVWFSASAALISACAGLEMNSSSSPRCISRGRTKIVDLAQIFFGVSAMISDGGIDWQRTAVINVIKAPRQ